MTGSIIPIFTREAFIRSLITTVPGAQGPWLVQGMSFLGSVKWAFQGKNHEKQQRGLWLARTF